MSTYLDSVGLLKVGLKHDMLKLEAHTKNLTNINKTFTAEHLVPNVETVNLRLPSADVLIRGDVNFSEDNIAWLENESILTKLQVSNGIPVKFFSPGISIEAEMIGLNDTKRAYETTIKLFNNTKSMTDQYYNIGK